MGKTQKSPAFPKHPLLNLSNRQKDLKLSAPAVRALVRAVLEHQKVFCQELSVYFVSEPRICKLHDEFFNDPSPTDCITFPIDAAFLGEIFVCPKAAVAYAQEHGGDPYEETALYIIHGILHLLGYDDLEPAKRRVMRKMEKRCMAHIKAKMISLRPQ